MNIWLSLIVLSIAFITAAAQKPQDEVTHSAVPLRVHLLADGTIGIACEPLGTVADLSKLRNRVEHIFAERRRNGVFDPEQQQHTKAGVNLPLARKVIVQAEPAVAFADVLRVLRVVRDLGAQPLDLQVADGDGSLIIAVPVLADADQDIQMLKPNPLTLVVTVRADHQFALNSEVQDSYKALLERLAEIFRRREELKAYRPGSKEIEATLFLKADPSLSFPTVVDLLRELKQVGANPLGLQIDDLSSR